jgi:hypothetical protein
MSRATPQKTKGAAGWPRPGLAGPASDLPLAHRDHGPAGPDGPGGCRRPLSADEWAVRALGGGSPLSAAGPGTVDRDHLSPRSRRRRAPLSAASAPSRTSGGRSWLSAAGAGPMGRDHQREMVPAWREKPGKLGPTPSSGGVPRDDLRLRRLWFGRAFDSTGCGLRPVRPQPVVPRARRRGGRRLLVTVGVPRARHEPPFGPRRNLERNARRQMRPRE